MEGIFDLSQNLTDVTEENLQSGLFDPATLNLFKVGDPNYRVGGAIALNNAVNTDLPKLDLLNDDHFAITGFTANNSNLFSGQIESPKTARLQGINGSVNDSLPVKYGVINALEKVDNLLGDFVESSELNNDISVAFGGQANLVKAKDLIKAWTTDDLKGLPQIEVRPEADIAEGQGAFAQATNTIYLGENFVRSHLGNTEKIAGVIVEEFGHFLDSQINSIETPGDEGEIFADLVQGNFLTADQFLSKQREDDWAIAFLNGERVGIEQANSDIVVSINSPYAVRPDQKGEVTVTYTNTGQTDTVAPLMNISATGALLESTNGNFTEDSVEFLGINNQGIAGILPAGASGSVKLSFLATGEAFQDIQFSVGMVEENTPIDWSGIKNNAKPETVPADAWDVIWNNFTGAVGNTAGQYQAVLADNATRLGQLGNYTNDASKLLAFELQQAGNYGSIPQRYTIGSLGRGWTFPFDMTITNDNDGNAILQSSGSIRFFTKEADGSYVSQPGDQGTLTKTTEGFQLVEKRGTVVNFRSDGKLDFIQDNNSNRITTNYTGSQLTGVNSTSGDSLAISYNGQERISQVVDQAGRITAYTYDPTGNLLLSATSPQGTTSYTYDANSILRSVTFPDNTQIFYEYDPQGRLIKQSLNGGAETITFEYDSAGGVTVIDANGAKTQILFNDVGQPGLIQDALGRPIQLKYDPNGNLLEQVAPGNLVSSFTYDDQDNLIKQINPLGTEVNFAYEPNFNGLSTVTDGRNNTTSYNYDDKGNLINIGYVPSRMEELSYDKGNVINSFQGVVGRLDNIQNSNGTNPPVSYYDEKGNLVTANVLSDIPAIDEQFSYDARGNVVKYVNRRDQEIQYSYDERDRLIKQVNPDGSQISFVYDQRDNLIAVTDSKGTISQEFDSADRITKITYPNGRFLEYRYDTGGRRVQMVDQDGFTINYAYDAVGRLAGLADGNGQKIVTYNYDNVGRLVREENGNGTYTTYDYDSAGQLVSMVNFSSNNQVNSRFDYTYDDLGRRTSMTTLEGTVQYGYDNSGQLTSVKLPDGRVIQYQYDAAGNRIGVTDNGVVTPYLANSLNQYTNVGEATYTYDADGNVISKTEGGKIWNYTYDVENRLVGVAGPEGLWSYEYDAFGNRIASTFNGQRTEYLVDPTGLGDVVGEYSNNNLVAKYTHGFGLESRVDATNNTAYYDFDGIGSTAGLTTGNGEYVNRYSYLPFGEDLTKFETIPNSFEYIGQFGVMDEGNGLDFMRRRYYDSVKGRFNSVDPIIQPGTNTYSYADNNSVQLIDPIGLDTFGVGLSLTGGLLGLGGTLGVSIVGDGNGGRALNLTVGGGVYLGNGISGTVDISRTNANNVSELTGSSIEVGGSAEIFGGSGGMSGVQGSTYTGVTGSFGVGIGTPEGHTFETYTWDPIQEFGNKLYQTENRYLDNPDDNTPYDKTPYKNIPKNIPHNKRDNTRTKKLPPPPLPPKDKGKTFNDPRLITFDEQYNDFQAAGEFTLVQSNNGDINVQVRQQPVDNNPQSNVADNTAVATILGGKRVGLYLKEGLLVDGLPVEIPDLDSFPVGNGRIYREDHTYTIVYPNNDQLIAQVKPNRININFHITKERAGQVTGLLGNFNGNLEDDIIKRDGTVLTQPISLQEIYGEYADSWRVQPNESLFDYKPGENTNTFTLINYPREKVKLSDLNPADVQRAYQLIGERINEIDPNLREGTIIDLILTDFDESVIDAAIEAGTISNGSVIIGDSLGARDDFAFINANLPIKLDILSNDTVHPNTPIAIASFDQISTGGGNITQDNNGTPDDASDDQLFYTPPINFTGTDRFKYTIFDGTQPSTAIVSINIPNLNLATLPNNQGVVIKSNTPGNFTGVAVNQIGDINGDQIADIATGAFAADPNGNNAAGETYVLFGTNQPVPNNIDPNTLNGTNGFTIKGMDNTGFSGGSVASAGDINKDGIDDIIIGAFGATVNGQNNAGKAYVIYGSRNPFPASIDVSTLNGANGFALTGLYEFSYAGVSVGTAGDFNRDGIDDLFINAPGPLNGQASKTYVVLGSATGFPPSINLGQPNNVNIITIDGLYTKSGGSVSAAGDVNKDGISDLIIGADTGGKDSYIVYGSANPPNTIYLYSPTNNSSTISGIDINPENGTNVSGIGDVNQDGIDDVIVSATSNNTDGIGSISKAYVVFGQAGNLPSNIDVKTLNGSNGFSITSTNIDSTSNMTVSGKGDFNKDGIADIILGKPNDNANIGNSYVIFGSKQPFPANIDVANLNGTDGLAILGTETDDLTGVSIASGSDVNKDTIDDIVIGAPGNLFNDSPGKSYVVYGDFNFGNSTSLVFDENYYLANNPEVNSAIASGQASNGLDHFSKYGVNEDRSFQVFLFNEKYYLQQNPEVNDLIAQGIVKSGLEHFTKFGQFEGRKATPANETIAQIKFDERYYLTQNPEVKELIEQRVVKSGFEHFLTYGQYEGRKPAA